MELITDVRKKISNKEEEIADSNTKIKTFVCRGMVRTVRYKVEYNERFDRI